jgi:hypothetical protein
MAWASVGSAIYYKKKTCKENFDVSPSEGPSSKSYIALKSRNNEKVQKLICLLFHARETRAKIRIKFLNAFALR